MMRWPWSPQHFDGWEGHLGAPGIVGLVLMIILWAAIIAALVLGIRALILHTRRNEVSPMTQGPTAGPPVGLAPAEGSSPTQAPTDSGGAPAGETATLLAILQERYARGDIDREEFLQRKQDLGLS